MLLALAGPASPTSAVADPLPVVDVRNGCVNWQPLRDFESVSRPGDDFGYFGVPGPGGTLGEARRARAISEGERIYSRWRALLQSAPLPSLNAQGERVRTPRIYVVRRERDLRVLGDFVAGAHAPYCAGDGRGARSDVSVILVGDDLARSDGDRLGSTLAHEAFHAFQTGSAGRYTGATWWDEATARWADLRLFPRPTPIPEKAAFLRPDIPLTHLGPGPRGSSDQEQLDHIAHPYGMWRFVQFLESFYEFEPGHFERGLRRSFAAEGRGGATVASVSEAFNPRDPDGFLRSALSGFWISNLFSHRYRSSAVSGPPRTPGTAMLSRSNRLFANAGDPFDTGPPVTVSLRAGPWATQTVGIPLAEGVGTVTYEVHQVQGGGVIGLSTGEYDETRPGQQNFTYTYGSGVGYSVRQGATGCLPAREVRVALVNASKLASRTARITFRAAGTSTGCA